MLVWTGDRIYLEMTINAILVHVVRKVDPQM